MPFDENHDLIDLSSLYEKLNKFSKEDIKIVLEQTGTYHLPILSYLLEKDYCLVAENALKIKKYLDRSLRKVGYEVMKSSKSSCKVDNELYNYMLQKESDGKCKEAAKIATLNKFLRQYYGILKKRYIEFGTW